MRKLLALCIFLGMLAVVIALTDVGGLHASQESFLQGALEGYLKEKGDGSIVVEEYAGVSYLLPVSERAVVVIDKAPASLKDFKPGMEVYAQVRDGRVILLEGYSTTNLGYISPGGKARSGLVVNIDRNQISVSLDTGGQEIYFTFPGTIVRKQGVKVPLNTLYVGDRVKLYFDEINSTIVSRLEIEGDSITVKDIYKGKLSINHRHVNGLGLEDVEVFRNGSWQEYKAFLSLPFVQDAPVYAGGRRILSQSLKYYTGSDIYVVVKDFFGSDRIERIMVKLGPEVMHTDKVREINWFAESFELEDNRNFFFNESTIVLQNGRLVDRYVLGAGAAVLVMAEGYGIDRTAGIVQVLDVGINNSNAGQSHLFAGRLDRVLEDSLRLDEFFVLEQNRWVSYSETKDLYHDNDTYIYDMEVGRQVSPKEFYSGDYAVDEDSSYTWDNKLSSWYGYIYADGERAAVVGLVKEFDNLLGQRVSTGIIESIEDDALVGWTMRLMDARDWSARNEQWMVKNAPVRVNLEKALIVKYGKMIGPDELRRGDRLYLLRDDFQARVVIVK